ncbi:hypothetical protein HA42_20875 [Pantoea deleyi]|nr:hypothetical protein HA42_20875 [Pantoea deleyi]
MLRWHKILLQEMSKKVSFMQSDHKKMLLMLIKHSVKTPHFLMSLKWLFLALFLIKTFSESLRLTKMAVL